MAKKQKSYSPEFKQQIVNFYHAGGTSYPQLKREYGISRSTLSSWVKQLSCSRKIIGYAYGTSMTAVLAVEAIKNVCLNVKDSRWIILHSDMGSQNTSQEFESFINSRGMVHSFSRKGNLYDNACIESFHSVLKKEEIHLHTYQDSRTADKSIFEYIEGWYN